MTEAYCRKCNGKRNILNSEIKEIAGTRGLKRFCIGNCEVCNNKISTILPNEHKIQESAPIQPKNNVLDEFIKDDIPVLKEIKNNKELRKIAKDEGIYIGDSRWYGILFSFSLISAMVFLIALPILIWGGYLKSSIDATLVCGNSTMVCEKTEINCPDCPTCNCPNITIPSCPEVNCYFGNST